MPQHMNQHLSLMTTASSFSSSGRAARFVLLISCLCGIIMMGPRQQVTAFVMFKPLMKFNSDGSPATTTEAPAELSPSGKIMSLIMIEDMGRNAGKVSGLDFGFKRGSAGVHIARHSQALGLASSAFAPGRKRIAAE
ncbi:hypothetical protein BV898_05864 [Hypsibius exemplaris]|uniref:Uncharacterized protein n=1 Tax=Hypsibius exemplaris TaxID=2072580 RepID=A0A1W0WXY7_HYPEX|nr:hypothetical protein BV898_05864 [Hypsibius exemplaris]